MTKPKPTTAPKAKIVLPPMPMPPGWFMPFWLDEDSWGWDEERRRFAIVLDDLLVQIVARRGVDWTWRVERLGSEVVTMDFGFRTALEARRDVLAVFWSDLWDGGASHEQWRNGNLQRFRQRHVQSEPVIATRLQWAAAIEDGGMFAVGDRIRHHKFGEGSVAAVDGSKLFIDFDHGGRKIVWDSIVRAVAEPKQA